MNSCNTFNKFFANCWSWLKPDFRHTYMDEAVVAYEDVMTLKPGAWLTDAILTFYYLYLSGNTRKESEVTNDDYLLINPTLTFWLAMAPDSAHEIFGDMDLQSKQLIFMPVSDSEDMESAGSGSHWSLVVYHKSSDTFYSYDSHQNHNEGAARRLAKAMSPLVSSKNQKFKFENRRTPQQTNGADCGCFVLAITQYLMEHAGDDSQLVSDGECVTSVSKLRSTILNLLGSLLQLQ